MTSTSPQRLPHASRAQNRPNARVCACALVVALWSLGALGCASGPPDRPSVVIDLSKLTPEDYPTKAASIDPQSTDVTWKLPAGARIPLQLSATSDVASIENADGAELVIAQPVWFRASPEGVWVSFDERTWQTPSEAFDGQLSAGFGLTADGPQVQVGLKAKRANP